MSPLSMYANDDDEEQRVLEEYLAMNQPALDELAGGAPPAQQLGVEALPAPAPMPEEEDPIEAYAAMTSPAAAPEGRPQTPWSSYDAPPQFKEKDNTMLWLAMGLDAVLNRGESVPQYMAQIAQPDDSAQQNWELRNKAMNDASSRAAQQAQAERARMQPMGNDLARQRFEAEQREKAALNSLDSPETQQWRKAAIAAGIVDEQTASQMTAEQLKALRPQLGQAVSQERGFDYASKGRQQSHSLAVQRQKLANEFANNRIEYSDYLRQMAAIDEGEQKAEGEAIKTAPDSPAVVQEQSEKYGQEVRYRGLDNVESKLVAVENMLAQYADGADIPGYGPIDGLKPDAMLGEEGRRNRRLVKELQDAKLRAATGAAAPPSEEATFATITGTGLFNTESDLRGGIEQARGVVDTQKSYLSEMYPSARQAGGQARPQKRTKRKATPRPASSMGQPAVTKGKELTQEEWDELQDLGGDF